MIAALTLVAWLSLLGVPAAAKAQPLTSAEAGAIDRLLKQEQAATSVPGIALVVRRQGEIVYRRGFGIDGYGRRFSAATPIWLGSLSKSFTAMAVMQLVAGGKVNLDQPVVRYLPEFTMHDPRGRAITVRNLMEHRSGLTDANLPDWTHPWPDTYPDATRRVHRVTELASAPGTQTAYHNGNYFVLADLVEHVSGERFEQYLARHVFAPLGLHSALAASHLDSVPPSVPPGYVFVLGYPVPLQPPRMFVGGAGGVIGSADDLSAWIEAFAASGQRPEQDKLLPHGMLAGLLRPQGGSPYVYAYGWVLRQRGTDLIRHSGGLPTFAAHAAFAPDDSLNIAVTTNASLANATWSDIGSDIVDGVVAVLRHKPPAPVATTRVGPRVEGVALILTMLVGALTPRLARAGRWQARLRSAEGKRRWWVWFRACILPLAAIGVVFVGLPTLVGFVESWSWFWLWFTSPVVTTCLWVLALLAAGLLVARCRAMRAADG